ncbi:hypothetical protein [Clostridium beijerinckii]|uniref:hypothetical protein n=1 Tax=Clostridium beijerinckii TaxID=1520 RepID=UPI001F4C45F6|nr:hypothetical protein [Clostridium beijerinckii]NRU74388.1 hypothetical protein [Clostridium beijerinckii]
MDNEKETYNKNESKKICDDENFVNNDFFDIECDYCLNEEENVENFGKEEIKNTTLVSKEANLRFMLVAI